MAKKLSAEMRKRCVSAIRETWQQIGGDILDANGGGDMDREDVIEVVLDADNVLLNSRDHEAAKVLDGLPYEVQNEIGREAFPAKRYGY